MRNSTAIAFVVAITMLTLVAFPATAEEPSHGGSLTNTHNDLYIVQEDADNPQGIEAGYGHLFVKETISFANDDPLKIPDYGIVFVDPSFAADPATPIVVKYTHDYTISNYTLQLVNVTDSYVGNFTGYTGTTTALEPGIDLGPEGPDEPHPKVNATYLWQVWAVTEQNSQLLSEFGGEVTTEIFNDTVFDWSELPLPELGPHSYEADPSDLARLTLSSYLEPHPSLSTGWYRYRITDEVFEYGVNLTIELRYTGEIVSRKVVMDKFIFTTRIIHVDVYHDGDMEALMFVDPGGKGSQIPPTESSPGPGDPTMFAVETSFSLVVREEGTDSTDWSQYGRYALLGILIAVLLFLVLWSGKGKRSREGEDEGPDEGDETATRRAELEGLKDAIMAQIKELDQRHEEGELGTGVWTRKRKSLKGRVVDVMRQLDELDGTPSREADDGPEPTGETTGLEAEKTEILEKIKDLDRRHTEGEVSDDVWKRKRKHLKAEAVEIMQEIEAIEEE